MRHIQTCIIAWNRGDEASLSVLSCMFVQKGGIRLFKVVHTGDSTLRSYLGTLGPTFSKGAPIQGGQHRGQYFKGQYFKKLSWYSWANIQQSCHGTIGPTFSKVIMVLLGQHSAKLSWYYWANIQQSYHGIIGPTFSKVIMVLLGQHSAKEHLFKVVNTGDSTHKGYQTRL